MAWKNSGRMRRWGEGTNFSEEPIMCCSWNTSFQSGHRVVQIVNDDKMKWGAVCQNVRFNTLLLVITHTQNVRFNTLLLVITHVNFKIFWRGLLWKSRMFNFFADNFGARLSAFKPVILTAPYWFGLLFHG